MINNRKAYSVDCDGNLAYTPDTIFLLKRNWKSRKKIEVSQREFDEILIDNLNWRRLNDNPEESLINFIKPGNYKKSIFDALDNCTMWPSRNNFIEATEYAFPISKITARAQSWEELKDTHRAVIYDVLSVEKREHLVENMKQYLNANLTRDQAIELYLHNNLYLSVQSQEFLDMSHTTLDIPMKIRKNIWFEKFVWHVETLFSVYYWKQFIDDPKFSIWFSDDNLQNSQAMINFIRSNLLSKYPKVKFVVYNTHDFENVKKIIIK